jgi:hypothetical protein
VHVTGFSAPAVGSVLLDRYELVRHLARGGMADVYEAADRQLERRVAVKLFRGAAAGDRARFDAEVVVLAALNHPGLVSVYDAGEQDGDAFVVLELIEGPTLAARLAERGPLPAAEVAELGAQVADALAFVHERGVVHRDVTPSNVLCAPDGRPRLADFGIARLVDTTRITATATTVGTAAFMAPEQVRGHDVTAAADVYALGLVLLELLTGRRAFDGAPHEVAMARLARDPDTHTDVPGGWRHLLGEMTDRAAPSRPSASAVRDRLRALVTAAADVTAAVVTVPSVVVAAPSGEGPASSDAVTASNPAAASSADPGTTVMPAVLLPAAEPVRRAGWRRAVVAAAVGALLLVVALGATGDGTGRLESPATTSPPATEPVVAVPPTTTTTVPATTEPSAPPKPAPHEPGKGKDDPKDKGPGRDG